MRQGRGVRAAEGRGRGGSAACKPCMLPGAPTPCRRLLCPDVPPLPRLPALPISPASSSLCPSPQALSLILDVLCGITSREEDEAVREALAEAVLCLARVEGARKQLWKVDAPTLLQRG